VVIEINDRFLPLYTFDLNGDKQSSIIMIIGVIA
jgi:hypothetical protein